MLKVAFTSWSKMGAYKVFHTYKLGAYKVFLTYKIDAYKVYNTYKIDAYKYSIHTQLLLIRCSIHTKLLLINCSIHTKLLLIRCSIHTTKIRSKTWMDWIGSFHELTVWSYMVLDMMLFFDHCESVLVTSDMCYQNHKQFWGAGHLSSLHVDKCLLLFTCK